MVVSKMADSNGCNVSVTVNNESAPSSNRQIRTGRQLVTITPLPPGYHPPNVPRGHQWFDRIKKMTLCLKSRSWSFRSKLDPRFSVGYGPFDDASTSRAIYQEVDILLLEDPLSAVDAPVARHIFER